MSNEVEIVVTGEDRSAPAFASANRNARSLSSTIGSLARGTMVAMAGVGAAAAGGAVTAGLALAAVPIAIGGIGVAAAAQSQKVKSAFTGLKDHVVKEVKQLAAPFEPVLVDIATKAKAAFDKIGPTLGQMFTTAAPMVEKLAVALMALVTGALPGIQTALNAAKPAFDALVAGLTNMGPAISGFFTNLSAGAGPASTAITNLFNVINGLLPILGTVLAKAAEWSGVLIPLAAGIAAVAAVVQVVTFAMTAYNAIVAVVRGVTMAWAAVQWVLNAALIANPIGIVVVAIAAFVAAIILAWRNSETFRSIVLAAWSAVKAGISAAISGIKTAINWFASLPGLFRGWWNGAVNAVTSAVSNIMGKIRALPGQIRGILGNLGSLLVGAGRSLIEGLWNGFQSAVGWVKSKISGALSSIRNLFPFSPAKEGPFSGTGYTTYSGRALAEDFARGMASTTGTVRRAAEGVLNSGPMAALLELREAIQSGAKVHEDLSYNGMSANFAKHHPALRDEYAKMVKPGEGMIASMLRFIDSRTASVAPVAGARGGAQGGGGAGGAFQLVASPTADSDVAAFIQALVRTGKLQLVRA